MFNVEYRTLDKLGRTKKSYYGGVFRNEKMVETFMRDIIESNKDKVAFEVYKLNEDFFKVS